MFAICEIWGARPFESQDSAGVESDIPALVLAGEFDPATPPDYGSQVNATLKNSYFFEFPAEGHSPSTSAVQDCTLEIALSFLEDPTSPPASACITEINPVQYAVP